MIAAVCDEVSSCVTLIHAVQVGMYGTDLTITLE